VTGENFDDFSREVVTGGDEFRRRVEEARHTLVTHRV